MSKTTNPPDTNTKMLQILIDGQVQIRSDIKSLDEKFTKKMDEVNDRLDRQGASLAYLEEDAPTIAEFDKLEKKS